MDHIPATDVVGDGDTWWDAGLAARSYYGYDYRLAFTGLESSFGAEGVLRGEWGTRKGETIVVVYTELLLNQRFDANILTDYALRESFANNFDIDTFEISQMAIVIQRGYLAFEIGRFVTPFGRYYGMSFQNNLADSPFIRSEAILDYETGAQLRWNPGRFRSTFAITNGSEQRDTNSSKALIARFGYEGQRFSFGGSIKTQDGIGSEGQKEFNNHTGVDLMIRLSDSLIFSTELIYDEYGLRRPGYKLDDIFWGRSIYNRQLNNGLNQPITGIGYYVSLMGQRPRFDWSVSLGQFAPEAIGDPIHDTVTTRGVAHLGWHLSDSVDLYTSLLIENSLDNAQNGSHRSGRMFSSGLQVRW